MIKKILLILGFSFLFVGSVNAVSFNVNYDYTYGQHFTGSIPVNGISGNVLGDSFFYRSGGRDAFCLDPNLAVTRSGEAISPHIPALEDYHTKSIYDYHFETYGTVEGKEAKEFTSSMMRLGQLYYDQAIEPINGSAYKDMSTALRMLWFAYGWNTDWGNGKNYPGASSTLYNAYTKGLSALNGKAKEFYETRPYGNLNDKSTQADGFVYGEGFWEARAMPVDEQWYPGLTKNETTGKYTLNVMFKTNIRAGGLACNNITYSQDLFDCEVSDRSDELFAGKGVVYVHMKTKDGVELDGFDGFVATYNDIREPSNFWITAKYDTIGGYINKSGLAYQRMYLISPHSGSIILNLAAPPSTPAKTCYKSGNDYYGSSGSKVSSENEFIDQCVCNTATKTPIKSSLRSSLSPEGAKRYDQYCGTTSSVRCDPIVYNQDCNNGTSFTIGDNDDCVFSFNNIDKDVNESTTGKKYTYNKNKYCSMTCSERVTFSLPGKVSSVLAGRYWTWDPDKDAESIMITGRRKCQATVDVSGFLKDENDIKVDQDKLRTTYRRYNGISDSTASHSSVASQDIYHTETRCSGWGRNRSCWDVSVYDYTKYCWKASATIHNEVENRDETFYRYYDGASSSGFCGSNGYTTSSDYTNGSKTLTAAKEELKTKYDTTVENLKKNNGFISSCADTLSDNLSKETHSLTQYDFDPEVEFSYDDKVYKLDFAGKKFAKYREDHIEIDRDSYSTSTDSLAYYPSIDSSYTTNLDYYYSPNSNFQIRRTKYFQSPVTYYVPYNSFSKGVASATDTNGYKLGNKAYPVSLNETAGTHKYSFLFTNIGVDKNGTTSTGRFNKVNNNKPIEYYCTYNVKKDIVVEKPNFFYRNVSLNSFNPNNRTLGKNWNNEKGLATICEITGNNYDGCTGRKSTPEETYNTDDNLQYHFVLTPQNMQNIRRYNLQKESETGGKGYSDWRMTTINRISNQNSSQQSIWFTSDFITEAKAKGYVDEVDYEKGRNSFKAWTGTVNSSLGLGPAWK